MERNQARRRKKYRLIGGIYLSRTEAELLCALVIVLAAGFALFTGRGTREVSDFAFEPNMSYTGSMNAIQFEGTGVLTTSSGDVLHAEWEKGLPEGAGRFISHAGWTLEGSFVKGVLSGEIRLTTEDGKLYSRSDGTVYVLQQDGGKEAAR